MKVSTSEKILELISRHIARVFCIGYILYIVGLTMGHVGEFANCKEPIPWFFPVFMFFVLAVPSYLAYEAGKVDGATSERLTNIKGPKW